MLCKFAIRVKGGRVACGVESIRTMEVGGPEGNCRGISDFNMKFGGSWKYTIG